MLGGRVLLKCENLQRCGAFKFRGAYNRLSALSESKRKAGVVALSTGNHAQGIALAAKLLGMKATIVMPDYAPKLKLENTRGYGAEIVTYSATDDRDKVCQRVLTERGGTFVHPYDDPWVIAGQGTVGLEINAQTDELDNVVICCGGGGLAAGITLAVKDKFPHAQIYIVEPVGFDDCVRALTSDEPQGNVPGATTICDAIVTPWPGKLCMPILRHYGAKGLTITDDEVKMAMRLAFNKLKLVVEPGGAAALAAVLAQKVPLAGKTTAVILSGGNADPALFAEIIR